jgi:hypothetical protein
MYVYIFVLIYLSLVTKWYILIIQRGNKRNDVEENIAKTKLNSMVLVRERTIPTKRPPENIALL